MIDLYPKLHAFSSNVRALPFSVHIIEARLHYSDKQESAKGVALLHASANFERSGSYAGLDRCFLIRVERYE